MTATSVGDNLPINFANQVVPVFTKLGCNSGGCHGKASGQNGFHLSLLGFEPDVDYAALVKEGRGRRLLPAAPDASLLLLKASGATAHGGGKMDPSSDEYKVVRRWIAAGMPLGKPTDPVVTSITAFPEHRVLAKDDRQQFAVYAHYTDGSAEDVTRRAQYESNDTTSPPSSRQGWCGRSGCPARRRSWPATRGRSPSSAPPCRSAEAAPKSDFDADAPHVDKLTKKKWDELGIVPSGLCSDEQFIRRASLDITGTLPTPDQVKAFAADSDARKARQAGRSAAGDAGIQLLLREQVGRRAARASAAATTRGTRAAGTFAFHDWIREAIAADKPYDEFVRDILTAVGDEDKTPADGVVQGLRDARAVRGQRLPGVPRPAAGVRPVPPPPLREVEPGRLLGPGRVLSAASARRHVPQPGSTQNQQEASQVLFTKASGTVHEQADGQDGRAQAARRRGR